MKLASTSIGVRRLPIYNYKGVDYFVDFHLKEMRVAGYEFLPPGIQFSELDDKTKADLRGLRSEFWHNDYIPELDD